MPPSRRRSPSSPLPSPSFSSPEIPASLPGWNPGSSRPLGPPLSPAPGVDAGSPGGGSDEQPGMPPGPSEAAGPTPTSGTEPGVDPVADPPAPRRIADVASATFFTRKVKQAFTLLGFLANRRLTPYSEHAWRPDTEDLADVSEPIGRIIARHSPITGGEANDAADAFDAGFALFAYGIKSSEIAGADKRAARAAAGLSVQATSGGQVTPAPEPPPAPVVSSPVSLL